LHTIHLLKMKVDLLEIRRHRLLKESAWVTFGQVGSAIGALVGLRLLTEYLEPAVFGFATLLLGVVALGHGLAVNPLMQAVLRYYPDFSLAGEVHVLRTAVARTLRTIMVWISALLCFGAFAYAAMTGDWLWFGLAVLIAAIFSIEGARSLELTLFNAARQQRPMALWSVVEAWARPVAVVAVVVCLTTQVSAVLIGYLLASVAAYLLFFHVAVQRNDLAGEGELGREDGSIVRNLWSYALPLVPVAAAGWASGLADRYFVSGVLGLAEAGSYAAVYALVSRPFLMLSGVIEQTLRPVYYGAIAADDSERTRVVLRAWLALAVLGGGFGFALTLLLHELIAAWLLAEPYRMSAGLMPWIAAGYWLLIISHVFTRICYAHHDTKSVLVIEASGALLSLGMLFPLISAYGVIGAAAAVPLYFGAQLVIAFLLSRHHKERRHSADGLGVQK
jgi:O-antigen/teichoic acid export membrane protein